MANDYLISSFQNYDNPSGNLFSTFDLDFNIGGTATDDGFWNPGDPYTDGNNLLYVGHYFANGHLFLVHSRPPGTGSDYVSSPTANSGDPGYPTNFQTDLPTLITAPLPVCFAADTCIATPTGPAIVQDLVIGGWIRTSDGEPAKVKWIGRQTVHKLSAGPHMQPVRIRAGALGDGLPHCDLTVTADHGMVIDGLVINASALVNGTTIDWVPMGELPEQVTYYHVETEAHDVILANGAPAETFVDAVARSHFDNYQEYLDLYGAERLIPEMDRPRIAAQRLLPEAIKARLGIGATEYGAARLLA